MTVEIPETVYAQARAIVNDAKDPVSVAYLVALGIATERDRCANVVAQNLGRTNTYIVNAIRSGDAP